MSLRLTATACGICAARGDVHEDTRRPGCSTRTALRWPLDHAREGRGDCIVFEYDAPIVGHLDDGEAIFVLHDAEAQFLVDQIASLERCQEQLSTANVVPIDAPSHTEWNLERARLRFQRWYREHDHPPLNYEGSRADTVRRALQGRTDDPSDAELVERLTEDLEIHHAYLRRKAQGQVLILKTVPGHLWNLSYEANEAFCQGLFRASIAVCRAMLGYVIKQVARAGSVITRDVRVALDRVPDDVLAAQERKPAGEIHDLGNLAVHDPKSDFGEKEAHEVLQGTAALIEAIINRGGLVRRQSARLSPERRDQNKQSPFPESR